jgi:Ulp1 family protease
LSREIPVPVSHVNRLKQALFFLQRKKRLKIKKIESAKAFICRQRQKTLENDYFRKEICSPFFFRLAFQQKKLKQIGEKRQRTKVLKKVKVKASSTHEPSLLQELPNIHMVCAQAVASELTYNLHPIHSSLE